MLRRLGSISQISEYNLFSRQNWRLLCERATIAVGVANIPEGDCEGLKTDIKLSHKQHHGGKRIWERVKGYPENHFDRVPVGLQWHSDPIEFRNIWIRKVGDHDVKLS